MSAPHQQVVSSIQSSLSYSNAGRTSEPAAGLLTSAGKQAAIAPLRDPRDASKRKKTTSDDVQILAQQGLYAAAAESIRNEAKEFAANAKHHQQIADGMKRPSSAKAYKNIQSTIVSSSSLSQNNSMNRSAASMTPQPHAGNNSSIISNGIQRSPFVSRFAAFSPLDLISGLNSNNDNNTSGTNQNNNSRATAESRHETLISSGRIAYVKKRASSASSLLPGNSLSHGSFSKPPAVAESGLRINASTNISQIGKKKHSNNNNNNRPIVEALYTPDVEIDRHFLVKERLRAKEKREGVHAGEMSSFKSVPRPEPGEESLSFGGITKTSKQKIISRQPPPVGAYNPHYEAQEHKIQGFLFKSPVNNNNQNSSLNNTNEVHQNQNQNNNNNRSPPSSHHHQQQHNRHQQSPNSVSQQFASVGTFELINTSTANFRSVTSGQAEASFRGVRPNDRGMPGLHNNDGSVGSATNNNQGRKSPDFTHMHQEQQKQLEEQLKAGARIPTPDHATFSTQGTASFASKAPRFSTESTKRDKKGNLVPPPPPPESPYPIIKVGSAVRPTGGGAIGAPLGDFTVPPDLPQKHNAKGICGGSGGNGHFSIPRSLSRNNDTSISNNSGTTPQQTSLILNVSVTVSNTNSATFNQQQNSPSSHQKSQIHQNRSSSSLSLHHHHHHHHQPNTSSPPPSSFLLLSAPKTEARVRKTFLDDLRAPGYSERFRADDVAVRPRLSTGIAFDKAAGRYGHSIKTAASLRFQPIRSIGRVADQEEVALKGASGGGGAGLLNSGPQEKFLDTSMVARVNTKHDTEVLSTQHRVQSGLAFEKQYGDHQDKHSVVAGGDQRLKPSSVMTSLIPLEHPYNSFTASRVPGYVALDKQGGGAKKNTAANHRKINIFEDPEQQLRAKRSYSSSSDNNNRDQHHHHQPTNDENPSKDKTFIDLSYPRTRSAIVLKSASEGHHHNGEPSSTTAFDSPSRFKFIQQQKQQHHHQEMAIDKPLDDFRHLRSPSAFFPKTSHTSYIVTRSDGSGPTGKNVTKNNKINNNNNNSDADGDPPSIPLERLKAAEQAIQPNTKGLFDISRTLSRDDRDRRWNAAAREMKTTKKRF